MQDLTRRTLRTWAVVEPLYGLGVAAVAAWAIPWKTPAANAALLAYGALSVAAGIGLGLRRRWGWRLALLGGWLGLAAAALLTAGLVASWAYLRGVYDDFGEGAALGALLAASGVLQVLGLVPALKLVALLRREVRADLRGGGLARRASAGLLLLPVLGGLAGHRAADLDALPPVPAEGRAEALAAARAVLAGEAPPEMPHLAGVPVGPLPLRLGLWARGEERFHGEGDGADLAEAVVAAARALRASAGRARLAGRLVFDRTVGVADVPFQGVPALADPVLALSVNPGREGLAAGDRRLAPAELVKREWFGATAIIPSIREIRLGLDARAARAALGGARSIRRFRTETWVATAEGLAVAERLNTPGETGPAAWAEAARLAGRYIVGQLRPDGRFTYRADPLKGRALPMPRRTNVPRHAGTLYALSELYAETGDPRLARAAGAAADWLAGATRDDCGLPGRCIGGRRRVGLGSAALGAVGLLSWQIATGETRHAETTRGLVRFIEAMQRPDGEFHHRLDTGTGRPVAEAREMFVSEEAALALVLAHEAFGDADALDAARRALDYLTGPKYARFFLGRFIYGADVWTCVAAARAWPRLDAPRYADFCAGYARFLRRLQYGPRGWDSRDFIGHYGFSGLLVPQAPAAAGFTEAVDAAWLLALRHGRPAADLRAQAALALDALARDQVRPGNDWMMPRPSRFHGAIRRSLVEPEVRIDFPQHALTALLGGVRAARLEEAG